MPEPLKSERSLFLAEERKLKIVEYIQEHKKATVQELCELYKVSSATMRNDLRELDKEGLLTRIHGGALVPSQTGYMQDVDRRIERLVEKRRIAAEAIKRIQDGDTIILDTGTTTTELARLLNQRRNIAVLTNDLRIALMVEPYASVNVIAMGGLVRRNFHCTVGTSGRNILSGLAVDKAFMGANSLSLEFGASTPDLDTAETKKAMIAIATKVILLCDHSKLNRRSFAQFASLDDIDTLITDAIENADRVRLEENDIEVVVAGVDDGH